MMAKKSFWKLPAALAVSMALLLASCGGDDGPNIPVSNAGLGTNLTLSGFVSEFSWVTYFVPFAPSTTITGITTLPIPLGVTGTIETNGWFSFELPAAVDPAWLGPFVLPADVEGVPNVSISRPNAQGFAVNQFDVTYTFPNRPSLTGTGISAFNRGNIRAIEESVIIENVSFVYVDMDVTLTLSQPVVRNAAGILFTLNPFIINYERGWNAIHTRVVTTENGVTVSVRGGDFEGLRWMLATY